MLHPMHSPRQYWAAWEDGGGGGKAGALVLPLGVS